MAQQRIIWFAIVMSTLIYLFLLYMLMPGFPPDFDASVRTPPVPILYGVALFLFLFTWFGLRRILPGRDSRQLLIVHMAMFEAVAIMGLLSAFLVRDLRLFLGPWALALIGFIREFPRETAADRVRV
ncbi:MAG TPA: hypothetical protein VM733_21510 [Thermoanaerobaculia bacterium]|nr:hypothetical protein [Thermoanaerobaculia bacterium]